MASSAMLDTLREVIFVDGCKVYDELIKHDAFRPANSRVVERDGKI